MLTIFRMPFRLLNSNHLFKKRDNGTIIDCIKHCLLAKVFHFKIDEGIKTDRKSILSEIWDLIFSSGISKGLYLFIYFFLKIEINSFQIMKA